MNEAKKCPKCGGATEVGYTRGGGRWLRGRSLLRAEFSLELPRLIGYACKNCGYVEFYVERKATKLKAGI